MSVVPLKVKILCSSTCQNTSFRYFVEDEYSHYQSRVFSIDTYSVSIKVKIYRYCFQIDSPPTLKESTIALTVLGTTH